MLLILEDLKQLATKNKKLKPKRQEGGASAKDVYAIKGEGSEDIIL